MKKIIFIFILVITVTTAHSQHKLLKSLSSAKDDSYTADNSGNLSYIFSPTIHNPYAPAGTVPFPVNYCDYATNGNNMRRLAVLGDTIIVAADINTDRTGPPPVTTVNRIFYQVSIDAGITWLTGSINTSPVSNRYPNVVPIFNSGLRSVVFMGRYYYSNNTATQRGLAGVETMLGLGSIVNYLTTTGYYRDYFGGFKNNNMIGGLITSPPNSILPTDILWYMDFNYVNGSFGTAVQVADSIDSNFRYFCDIANNEQNIVAARWKSTNEWHPQAYYVHESTNGGNTWSAGTMIGNAKPVNGDSCVAWLSFDVIYKPGTTQKCLAFATLSPSNTVTREASKILFWSPNINGGNPVVVCDYHKYWFLNDTAIWNHNQNNMQIGMAPFSHPTLAYSDDGAVLYCAFSGIQKDTSYYTNGLNYHFNNILICKSTDDGATWSNLYYVIRTNRRDETYPSLSKKGNTATVFNIVYNESGSPGSFTFYNNAPTDTVYTVFKRLVFSSLMGEILNVNNNLNEKPEHYSLYQNYPNPFNPVTKIKFEIPLPTGRQALTPPLGKGGRGMSSGGVSLKVYDMLGKEVAVLVNEQLQPGTYEVTFDGSNLPSGIYFYQFRTENFVETKKLILLK